MVFIGRRTKFALIEGKKAYVIKCTTPNCKACLILKTTVGGDRSTHISTILGKFFKSYFLLIKNFSYDYILITFFPICQITLDLPHLSFCPIA